MQSCKTFTRYFLFLGLLPSLSLSECAIVSTICQAMPRLSFYYRVVVLSFTELGPPTFELETLGRYDRSKTVVL